MIEIRPDLDAARLGPLQDVASRAAARAPSPGWIIVEDETDSWLHELTTESAAQRSRGVVVTRSEKALLQCIRLAVGGALWEPPSTAAMALAFRAAQMQEGLPAVCDLCVTTALAAHEPPRFVARWCNQELWRAQLGEPRLAALLWRLAKIAGALPAVLPGPCLLLTEMRVREMARAYASLGEEGHIVPGDGLEILELPEARGPEQVVALALRLVVAGDIRGQGELTSRVVHADAADGVQGNAEGRLGAMSPRPVYELPSGRCLGWWSSVRREARPASGWLAMPELATGVEICWKLVGPDGEPETALEVVCSQDIPESGCRVVRLPGWASVRVRPGSPAGLLAEQLVRAAGRLGVTVWIPNATEDAVQMALRLGATVWVDGPAVPGKKPSLT